MKKGLIFVLIITSFIALFSFIVSAAPPFVQSTQQFNEGYVIKIPQISILKENTNFNFNFHVFNISNGFPINNESTSCAFHLYNKTGNQILEIAVPHSSSPTVNNEWDIDIDGNNFSYVGSYAYTIQCNSTDLGGFESVGIEVTSNGKEINYNYLIANLILIFIFIIFSLLLNWDKSKMDDEKYFNRMFSRWHDKNYLRFSATALWYVIKKNSYVLHYLIGLVIMILVYDISLVYALSITTLFKVLLILYVSGSLPVVIVLFGNVQEWIKDWLDKLEKINWGTLTSVK